VRGIKFRGNVSHIQTLGSSASNLPLNQARRRFSRSWTTGTTPGEDREDRSRGIDAAARTLQSHNLWHRRRETGMKRGGVRSEGEEGGRLTVREREEDRSAARTLRYQWEGDRGRRGDKHSLCALSALSNGQ